MCAGQQSPPPLPGFSYDADALYLAGNKAIQEADIPRGYGRGGARTRQARMNEVRQGAIAAEKERQRNAYYKQQQARADAISARRKEVAADQQRRQNELQAQSIAAQRSQQAEVKELQQQQDKRLAELQANDKAQRDKIKAETAQKVAGINRAGGAAATSLRVLAQKQPSAPQAVQTPRGRTRRGAGSTQANVARGAASSRGTNLSI